MLHSRSLLITYYLSISHMAVHKCQRYSLNLSHPLPSPFCPRLVPISAPLLGSVQSFSRVLLFATPWNAALQASLSITNSWNLLKLVSTESVMPSYHFILCYPFLLPPSIFPNKTVLRIRWPSIGVSASTLVLPMNIQD